MRRILKEGGLALGISLCYLLVMIVLRIPFFTIFIVGWVLLGIGIVGIIFFKEDLLAKKFSRYVGLVGILSSVLIWLFVHYLLSKLT